MDLVTIGWFIAGGALLVLGAELLVRGASRLATTVGISPLVIGLTVVAFGTSAPELAVTAGAAYAGQPDVAIGNVVGSSIFNVLFILGIAALIVPLVVAQQLVRLDVPVMIGSSLVLWALAYDGLIGRLDGLLLCGLTIAYVVFLIRLSRRETADIRSEYEEAFGQVSATPGRVLNGGLVVVGLALLVLGSRWLVDAAVGIASGLGISELVIGLTVVAAGTSLPEVATSVLAAVRGERDIAVGNVVGSNILNILCVLGVSSLISPAGIAVSTGALTFDIPVMTAVAIAVLPVAFTGYTIARWEGFVFVGYYVAYTTYLVLDATSHDALPAFGAAMSWFALPLTVLTLAIIALRAFRARGHGNLT